MKRLLATSLCLLSLFSCTFRNLNNTLSDIESYIMERPDSALAMLESIDRGNLGTARTKAHHALLYAMALDKNYIDVTEDSIAKVATDYYRKHGPRSNYARALYYLGKCYYYNKEYDKAILEYAKAEKIAEGCDSLYLGMIKVAQSDTYNNTYNSIEELNCCIDGLKIFIDIGAQKYLRSTMYSLGKAYHNCCKYEEAIQIYTSIIEATSEVDYYAIQAYLGKAHSMIELTSTNYETICSLFNKAHVLDATSYTEKDYWAWAYSLYRINKSNEAEEIIQNMTVTNELTANFWKMRISEYLKDFEACYMYSLYTDKYENNVVENILKESLASYQRDYYQAELESTEYQVKARTRGMIGAIVTAILIIIIICMVINRHFIKQKEENEKLLEYAEEIKRQLNEAQKNDFSELKKKYLALYKTRFETIGTLYDQYMMVNGRTDIESIIFRKVESLIKEINNDSVNRAALESMLDKDLDMIMTHLRQEMPKFKEIDYAIFCYHIIGFDATTISRLLNITVGNVYTHKHRIRTRIEEKNPEHASQFLEMLI